MSNNLKKRRVNPEKCEAKKCRCRSEYKSLHRKYYRYSYEETLNALSKRMEEEYIYIYNMYKNTHTRTCTLHRHLKPLTLIPPADPRH